MNHGNLGRGAFYYMTGITVLNLLNVLLSFFFFHDLRQVYEAETGGGPGRLEITALVSICLNLVFLFWNSILAKGWGRTLAAFVLTVLTAWLAEGLGVHYGYVFGHYHYSGMLGFQVWAVPMIVCLAWEPILYSAYCLTDFLVPSEFGGSESFLRRMLPYLVMAAIGGIATTAWDLMIDPFAVRRGWWVWEYGGPYMRDIANGVPISNFFGWWKVAFVCHLIYRLVLETGPHPRRSLYLSVYGPMMLYLNLFIGAMVGALLMLERPDVGMIGVACMGTLLLLGGAKIFLLKQGVEPSPADPWLQGRSGGVSAENLSNPPAPSVLQRATT